MAVHPHARGERATLAGGAHWRDGSSPRPWGTHAWKDKGNGRRRFIPTPVGNACRPCGAVRQGPVHPHARGERVAGKVKFEVAVGSSPRPWGTRQLVRRHRGGPRFIPTPVGNADQSRKMDGGDSVHPHARGERQVKGPALADHDGSSPRPWGTPSESVDCLHLARFIPTPVGNAPTKRWAPTASAVHPHARGERSRDAARQQRVFGSSPRPWGTPLRRRP